VRITYRELPLADLPHRVPELDVSEHGTVVYAWVDGVVTARPQEWDRPRWTRSSWREGSWTRVLDLPGVKAWGAFDRDRLVGLVVYRPHLSEGTAQLAALFVGRSHRRCGVAARLTDEVCRQARREGHARLYVSATPSESALGFYRAQEFTPTKEVHPELHALEPDDIHMVKAL
jgi:GNAT superfamily N-acetyltransferase